MPTPTVTGAAVRPGRLGAAYTRLWAAASVSYVGDGAYYTALPLLAASLTRDPLRVAAVEVAGQLPWLLLALPGGALADRWDRRRVMWLADAYRALVVAGLAAAVAAGWASIPLLGAAGFLLAVGGAMFNPASLSIVPAIVSREPARLERANGRLAAAQTVGEHFLGPPVGGVLFSLAQPLAFAANAVSFGLSAALIASIRGRFTATTPAPPLRLRVEIGEGLRWLAGHDLLRVLAVMVGVTSMGFTMWSAILVLYAQDRLGLGEVGFGLLWTGVAAGALLGSVVAARLSRLLGPGRALSLSAGLFGATILGIGLTTSPWLAGALLAALGAALTVWNVVVVSLRQRIVPDRLVGRVNSAFQLLSMGMMPAGAALGGLLARSLGLRAPFLCAGAALLLLAVLATPVVIRRASRPPGA